MAKITDNHNVWRDALVPASFRGVVFHTEASVRRSGRRVVVHEYPKRNDPYSEDMGRHARRFGVTGYLIHGDRRIPNVIDQRNKLVSALEEDDAGLFQHPSMSQISVVVEAYSVTEVKTKGGYFEFDLHFVEAGEPALTPVTDTVGAVGTAASAVEESSIGSAHDLDSAEFASEFQGSAVEFDQSSFTSAFGQPSDIFIPNFGNLGN